MDDLTVHIEELILDGAAASTGEGSTGEGLLGTIRGQAPGLTEAQLAAVARGVEEALRRLEAAGRGDRGPGES